MDTIGTFEDASSALGRKGPTVAESRLSARILLVEDDAIIAGAVRESLRCDGHCVDWVTDTRRAGAAFAETRYDLVILDLSLPDGDGIDLLGRWRAAERSTPVI